MTVLVWYRDGSRGVVSSRGLAEAAAFADRDGDVVAWFPVGASS